MHESIAMADPTQSMAIILAAGKSTRMKSETPKVLHPICGRPMIEYVLDAVRAAGVTRIVVVVGHKADEVKDALSQHSDLEFVLQAEQRGTGHAVLVCDEQLATHSGSVLVLAGDTPLLKPESLRDLLNQLDAQSAASVIGSAITADNFGLGRIVRDPDGNFRKIVEQRDATDEEQTITEINTGCYAFVSSELRSSLHEIKPDNSQAEYYLTDCPSILQSRGLNVAASPSLGIDEAKGVNTRVQLADVEQVLRNHKMIELMTSGVTIIDPQNTYIDLRTTIGVDTTIRPFTSIIGPSSIGSGCEIGPHACVDSASIADGSSVAPFQYVQG